MSIEKQNALIQSQFKFYVDVLLQTSLHYPHVNTPHLSIPAPHIASARGTCHPYLATAFGSKY